MGKPFSRWTVLPHGKLLPLEDDILSVTGKLQMPLVEVERRMTVVRLRDGRLVIYSAISLDETEMAALEKFGTPAFLIVPSALHRIDVKPWKDRYPSMKVIAPAGALEGIEKVVHVDATEADFGDPAVHFLTPAGTGAREAALEVRTSHGTTLILNDLIFNIASQPGLRGWLCEKLGITGDAPHVPGFVKVRAVEDVPALKAQLDHWSRLPDLRRAIVSHGNVIEKDAAAVLAKLALGL
jgi:hypothetical protein